MPVCARRSEVRRCHRPRAAFSVPSLMQDERPPDLAMHDQSKRPYRPSPPAKAGAKLLHPQPEGHIRAQKSAQSKQASGG